VEDQPKIPSVPNPETETDSPPERSEYGIPLEPLGEFPESFGSFARSLDAENQTGSGGIIEFPPYQTMVEFLIDRVQRVIEEAPQLGTEALSTKAATLAALYQAQALQKIAAGVESLALGLASIDGNVQEIADTLGALYQAQAPQKTAEIPGKIGELVDLLKSLTDGDRPHSAIRVVTYQAG
jgi:hypothetical protein